MIYDLHVLFNLSIVRGAFNAPSPCAKVCAIGPHYVVFVSEDVVIHTDGDFLLLDHFVRPGKYRSLGNESQCDMALRSFFRLASRSLTSISKNGGVKQKKCPGVTCAYLA